ncbi:MAG: ABC transporter permease [Oscillospiraceae bacterium]|nr:ABC transporter permease [Oscillospiraceae bacterium]
MNRVLSKRIFRDVKENFWRWLALFLMIVLGMYIVVAVVGAAENIITESTDFAEKNQVEDGEFSVFIPLTNEQEKSLRDMGITLECKFSADISLDDNSVLRVMKNRADINRVALGSGRLAEKNGEIALEKRYCEEHDYSIGDKIKIVDTDFEIVGIGTTPDYDMPIANFSDMAVESELFGTAFVTSEQYAEILKNGAQKVEDYTYAYRLGNGVTDKELKTAIKEFDFDYEQVDDEFFRETIAEALEKRDDLRDGVNELNDGAKSLRDALKKLAESGVILSEIAPEYIAELSAAHEGSEKLAEGTGELKEKTDELIDEIFAFKIENLTSFVSAADNPRILAAAGDMQMNKEMGLLAGVVVIALFAYVISVFVIHQVNRESSVIGALYALGAKKRDLLLHYITLPTMVTFLGGLVGAALGFSDAGIKWQMGDTYSYFSVPTLDTIYPAYLIIYSVIMPPLISIIVNSLVINKRLSQTALSLIRNEQKSSRLLSVNLKGNNFVRNFRIRQMLREIRTSVTVVIGMFISLLIFMLGLNCFILCESVKTDSVSSTKFEYMYTLKYPEKTAPEDSEPCYTESLSKTEMGYTLDISVIGIDNDNKYFDAKPKGGKNSIVLGKATAEKYRLHKGDKLILTDSANEMDYAFTVEDVCSYAAGLTAFMDIDGMRELFGQDDNYYNMLLSDNALNIDEGRIYSVTTRSDVERSSEVFTKLMIPMVIMIISVSVIIFFAVMYLMMGVMIDRSSFGISLMKVFGFRSSEARKLYLNGNTIITAIGAVIGIPLSKAAMDAIYPWAIANVGCGMNLRFEWYVYPLIFAGVMLVYFIVNAMLVRKINKITPAEVLKNRE